MTPDLRLLSGLSSRSLLGRFALRIALLALIATAALWLVTVLIVREQGDRLLQRNVDTDIAALADAYATGGRDELLARVADRIAMRARETDQAFYLVADSAGNRISGDGVRWPLLSAENSQAGFVTLSNGTPVFARATQLGPETRIVAARSYATRDALIRQLTFAFAAAGILIAALAVLLAAISTARLRARLARINAAFGAIEGGDLTRTIPDGEASDEFGELARYANRLVARLGTLIAAQRRVTDQVAHEIRTPLMHLDNRLLKLIERSIDPAAVASLGEARAEARRIAALLDSLLDIAASQARRGDRSGFKWFDLSALAGELADIYADSADELGLAFTTVIQPGVEMRGDSMQVTRLISNLLDNAFKYVPAGGRVELAVAPGPVISVRDDGPGVPADMSAQIFDSFQRVPGSAGQGHGLGLALARAIAERHELTVACEDAGPGALFVVRPAVDQARAED